MATAKKKKISNIGQVSYLTKQVESLEKDLVRKDIEKLDQKVDGVKTELSNKIEKLDQKVDGVKTELSNKIEKLDQKVDGVKTELSNKIEKLDQKVDNLETNLNTKIDSLKNNNKIILGILAVLVTAIFYLHSDTKQDMKELRQDMKDLKQDMKELRQDINTKLDKLIERDLRK